MTVQGTIGRSIVLLAILSATATSAWNAPLSGEMKPVVLPVAVIGALVLSIVTIVRPRSAPWTAPVYAAFEGVALGAISALIDQAFQKRYPGIAIQAISMTFGTLFVMLFAYGSGL